MTPARAVSTFGAVAVAALAPALEAMPQLTSLSLAGTTHTRTCARARAHTRVRAHAYAHADTHTHYTRTHTHARAQDIPAHDAAVGSCVCRASGVRMRSAVLLSYRAQRSRATVWGPQACTRVGAAVQQAYGGRAHSAHGERCAAMRRELSRRRGRGGTRAGAPHDVAADVAQPRRHRPRAHGCARTYRLTVSRSQRGRGAPWQPFDWANGPIVPQCNRPLRLVRACRGALAAASRWPITAPAAMAPRYSRSHVQPRRATIIVGQRRA